MISFQKRSLTTDRFTTSPCMWSTLQPRYNANSGSHAK